MTTNRGEDQLARQPEIPEMRPSGLADVPLEESCHVVGIGASAGGLEALERFAQKVPLGSRLALVIIQHLSPDFRSMMDEILARHTRLRIRHIEDGMRVEPDTIYLNPPRVNVTLRHGHLFLNETSTRGDLNLPIDQFFNSLAEDQGERAIAIVLSGTGTDGTRGLRAIKERGGLVIVQDESAKFDGMPRSAIATGLADIVLAPEEMPEQLLRFIANPCMRPPPTASRLMNEGSKLDMILRLIQEQTQLDFNAYKTGTVCRRIERRMCVNHIEHPDDFILLLRQSPGEVRTLAREMLIGVTRFFREPELWEVLRRETLPRLIADTPTTAPLRFWIAGCSTGEEAYSLAIVISECFELLSTSREVKIFATDIDKEALDTAGEGVYPEVAAADIGPARIHRHFRQVGDRYVINRPLRECVIFARHNLLIDPPFTKLDLISCRNLLIYLQTEAQKRVLARFHYGLRGGGALLLGASESIGEYAPAFRALNERHRLYTKVPGSMLPFAATGSERDTATQLHAPLITAEPRRRGIDGTLARAYDFLSSEYAPPGLLLTEELEILHSFGDVSDFVSFPSGAFTADVSQIAAADVRVPLCTAAYRAIRQKERVVLKDVRLRGQLETRVVTIRVELLPNPRNERPLLLALFEERAREPLPSDPTEVFNADEHTARRIRDLEMDLQQTRENLQATIEELETSNEELQSTNEELMASNEELQSTNEELHSVNEELYTVNAEHQNKIAELLVLTNDFDNLLRTTEIGVVFVDRELQIRKFTPAAARFIHLVPHDIGRPIEHFTHDLSQEDLVDQIREVIRTGQPRSREVRTRSGQTVLLTILPFIVQQAVVDGAVITLVDISAIRRSEIAVRDTEQFLRCTLDALSDHIAILDSAGKILFVNEAWRRFALANGYEARDFGVGANYLDVFSGKYAKDAPPEEIFQGIRSVLEGRSESFAAEYPCHSPTERRWFHMRVSPLPGSGERRIAISHENMTESKLANETRAALAAIVESSRDPIMSKDREGRILTWNAAAERLYGFSAAEIVGRHHSVLVPPDRVEELQQAFDLVLAKHSTAQLDTIRVARSGQEHVMWITMSPIHGERGEVIGVSTIERDLTERRRAEAELRRTAEALEDSNDKLRRSNEALEQFASIAAHDLQEPLRTIKGYCQLIRERTPDKKAQQHFERIDSALGNLQQLIDHLRRYSQILPDESDLQPTDTAALVDRVVLSLHERVAECGATIIRRDLPVVRANPILLQHVFQNLIDNAVKYRGERPPEVEITAQRTGPDWTFAVRDNGIGIEPAHHERAFQMFRRIAPREGCAGAGVGLAIARRIVDKHGGRIWLQSEPGRGSTFYFSIPIANNEASGNDSQADSSRGR